MTAVQFAVREPVGASLLAIADWQATPLSNVWPSSRASSLPQWFSSDQWLPECPKPPAPRSVSTNSSTISKCA
ncbi:hypothetical protein C9I50_07890 [Pseudomonas prosekii]|uniref:Uncharacterized protein n=1 Tax=Pseudomonas prosekii TaxID=1148509 RepID=A0A2U2D9S5_9PSED|nr:hypothetical protein C9I50_07890 [Pseudomonas prosekii]PWE45782.1 hypothetical protein C9I49_09515 [Pseudomonas prosekii]